MGNFQLSLLNQREIAEVMLDYDHVRRGGRGGVCVCVYVCACVRV